MTKKKCFSPTYFLKPTEQSWRLFSKEDPSQPYKQSPKTHSTQHLTLLFACEFIEILPVTSLIFFKVLQFYMLMDTHTAASLTDSLGTTEFHWMPWSVSIFSFPLHAIPPLSALTSLATIIVLNLKASVSLFCATNPPAERRASHSWW